MCVEMETVVLRSLIFLLKNETWTLSPNRTSKRFRNLNSKPLTEGQDGRPCWKGASQPQTMDPSTSQLCSSYPWLICTLPRVAEAASVSYL